MRAPAQAPGRADAGILSRISRASSDSIPNSRTAAAASPVPRVTATSDPTPVPNARNRLGIAPSTPIIGVNWATYIYGVNSSRVVETALGYFITPLVVVLLGVTVQRERLRAWTA